MNPLPLKGIEVDPPTVSMNFVPNDSPFYGKEGRFVTSRHLRDRLFRETLSDVALVVEELEDARDTRYPAGENSIFPSLSKR